MDDIHVVPHHRKKMETATKGFDDNFATLDHSNGNSPRDSPSPRFFLDIFSDFDSQKSRTVELDRCATALQTLQVLLTANHCGDCTNWVILEWKRALCMWRIVEDHECLGDIQDGWHGAMDGEYNRFVLKQDYCKYEVFRNPRQFFPPGMLSLCNDKLEMLTDEHPAAQNSFLRSLILSTNWSPEVEGSLHLREKKTWKKQFCVLRPSGLYVSEKGNSKDPKNLSLWSPVDTVNTYQVENGRKMLGAPTEWVFCIGNSCDISAKYLCCDDEEMRRNWIVALRFEKCGKQLKTNYEAATQADHLLNTTENIKDLHIQEDLKSRVPMDFSGVCGRVIVENQQEAIAALMTEVQGWKKRRTGRIIEHPVSSPSPTGYPVHLSQAWYHGGMTREEATRLLSKQGLVDGVFLVRKSRSEPRCYVLSFIYSGKIKHHQIVPAKVNDQTCFTLDEGKTKFSDLTQLVEFHQLNHGGLPTRLTYAVKPVESPKR